MSDRPQPRDYSSEEEFQTALANWRCGVPLPDSRRYDRHTYELMELYNAKAQRVIYLERRLAEISSGIAEVGKMKECVEVVWRSLLKVINT